MSPVIRKRLEAALAGAGTHFVECIADDVCHACESLPPDEITTRLAQACAGVVPSRPGKRHAERPTRRVWLGVRDLEHLLRPGQIEGAS